MSEPRDEEGDALGPARGSAGGGLIDELPGLARIYASAWWHAAEWTVESSLRAGLRLARAAVRGEGPTRMVDDAADELREYARRMAAIVDRDRSEAAPGAERPSRMDDEQTVEELRSRGEELLRLSADVSYSEGAHPAYERILSQLAPDEARILRLLAVRGPQPAVDVRAGLPLVSTLVAPGRNMIGAEAGVRYGERVPSYLNNLYRLGLIWFSREPLQDRLRYQVLEAQPDVLKDLRKGGRTARTIRRSIVLTPFGRDFCDVVLPLDTAELEALGTEGKDEEAGEEAGAPPADEPGATPEGGA